MNFKPLFQPKTLAVVGVSLTNDRHPANVIYHKNKFRQKAEVFPVNGRGGILQGETVFPRISDIPKKIDLAVIAARAEFIPDILTDCIQAGVGGAVVVSGGFSESGQNDLQDRLVAMAKEADFLFIGPNCLGIYSAPYVDTFFLPSERIVRPEKGKVAMVSQSGGFLVDQMIKFAEEGVGLSSAVSIGNKALIRELDLLRYFASDPETDVIAFYVEGFGKNEGREFVLSAAACPKPVIVFKSGKTTGGSRAVSSHTASLAGDYEVFSSVLSQFGVVEAKDEFELVSFCEALSCYQNPLDGKVGIITGSGGHGAISVDVCLSHKLSVPVLAEQSQVELKKMVSPRLEKIASFSNPIDLTGSGVDEDFVGAARFLSKCQEVDCVLLLLLPYSPGITSDLGARLSLMYRQEEKPLVAYVPHVEKYRMFVEGFQLNQVPVAHSIEAAVHMIEAMRRRQPC
jgi:acyl-CoA synthetase (NDP forming)